MERLEKNREIIVEGGEEYKVKREKVERELLKEDDRVLKKRIE
jgi:hypothetical protein